jgi:hypothetical protein
VCVHFILQESLSKDPNICKEGRNDALTQAIGTAEHGGRVRGLGKAVTVKNYFGPCYKIKNKTEGDSNLRIEHEKLKRKLSVCDTQISCLTKLVFRLASGEKPADMIDELQLLMRSQETPPDETDQEHGSNEAQDTAPVGAQETCMTPIGAQEEAANVPPTKFPKVNRIHL